jgi:hypothetical protein
MRSLIQVYALAVCFATLMCFVVALGVGMYDVLQIAAPSFTLESYQPYQSNDVFVQFFPDKKERPEGEITALREQALRDALHFEQRSAVQSGAFVLIILAINAGVFLVHWRIAGTQRPAPPPQG